MKTTKILSLLAIIFGFFQCKSIKLEDNPPFQIESATYKNWVGGIEGVSGTLLEIEIVNGSQIIYDTAFFHNKTSKIEVKTKNGNVLLLANFDTSKNQKPDLVMHSDSKKEINNKIPRTKEFPFDLKVNEAVISYKKGNKIKYFKIENFKKKKNLAYPSVRKQ